MNAQDKAKAGLWLIEEAILQLLREKGPMQPHDVEDALSLRWRLSEGEHPQGICYLIMLKMAKDGQLDKESGTRPPYSIRTGSTH
jgi:hypothetical protein